MRAAWLVLLLLPTSAAGATPVEMWFHGDVLHPDGQAIDPPVLAPEGDCITAGLTDAWRYEGVWSIYPLDEAGGRQYSAKTGFGDHFDIRGPVTVAIGISGMRSTDPYTVSLELGWSTSDTPTTLATWQATDGEVDGDGLLFTEAFTMPRASIQRHDWVGMSVTVDTPACVPADQIAFALEPWPRLSFDITDHMHIRASDLDPQREVAFLSVSHWEGWPAVTEETLDVRIDGRPATYESGIRGDYDGWYKADRTIIVPLPDGDGDHELTLTFSKDGANLTETPVTWTREQGRITEACVRLETAGGPDSYSQGCGVLHVTQESPSPLAPALVAVALAAAGRRRSLKPGPRKNHKR